MLIFLYFKFYFYLHSAKCTYMYLFSPCCTVIHFAKSALTICRWLLRRAICSIQTWIPLDFIFINCLSTILLTDHPLWYQNGKRLAALSFAECPPKWNGYQLKIEMKWRCNPNISTFIYGIHSSLHFSFAGASTGCSLTA